MFLCQSTKGITNNVLIPGLFLSENDLFYSVSDNFLTDALWKLVWPLVRTDEPLLELAGASENIFLMASRLVYL